MDTLNAWDQLHAMEDGQQFEMYHNSYKNVQTGSFHSHDFYEIYFFITGNSSIYIEEYAYQMSPGTVVIMPPGRMHRAVHHNPIAYYERMYINITRKTLLDMGSDAFSLLGILDECITQNKLCISLHEKVFTSFCQTIMEIINDSIGHIPYKMLINQNKLSILLIQLCKLLRDTEEPANARSSQRVANVIAYINEHISDDLSLDVIGSHFFISKYHLIREFKNYTNNTIHQYIAAKRIIQAKLLLQGGATPANTFTQCGFHEYSSFYRAFKKETNMSPHSYIERTKGY